MIQFLKNNKFVLIFLPLILLLAIFLRIYHLNSLPVFADEAIYVRWSQIMSVEPTLRFLPLSDGKQPLYMWILMLFVRKISDPLITGRLLSMLSGITTLVGLFFLTLTLFKSKTLSLISSFLYAISPYSVFFDRMALTDSMLATTCIWTLLLAILTAKTKRIDLAIFTGFALGASFLTKSPSVFFAYLLPTTFLLADWPKDFKQKIYLFIRLSLLFLISYTIAFALQSIMRLGPNYSLIASRNQDYVLPLSHIFKNPLDPFIPYFDRIFEWLRIMGPSALIILAIVGSFLNLRKNLKETILLSLWIMVPIALEAEFAKVITARYVLFTVPIFASLASSSFIFKTKAIKVCLYLMFAIFIIQSSIFDFLLLTNVKAAPLPRSERSGYLEEWTAGTGIRQVSEYLKKEHAKDPNIKIVAGTEGFFGTLPDGLQMYMEGTPNVVIIGVGLSIKEVPESLKQSFDYGNKTYLVINDSRFLYKGDPQDLGLKLIASFEKAARPDFVKEYWQHGPVEHLLLFQVIKKPIILKSIQN
ncbi:glycosyltransferase family 39 protein [Candidatus Woesebacteria bacterium]|nr:glycosyltransferase family 39 protein [Candidatus Woesebacteria bacterium]QQG47027.1 MAG: glycosyltransferase family 39 protein [Candidatus Woesebacteria bacterium]